MGVAVGIDLGTTNSCVAIVQGDQAKIVESVYGDRIQPSVVSFHPNGETLAGPQAKERLAVDPLNTVYSFKRLLGQDLNSKEIQHLVETLPYEVNEKNGIPVLKTRNREATLPEVSAIMLRYLREMASETYGVDIKDAIITVPANFTDVQRASTKIAGRIAGFNVLRILNEPTAAALAYGFGGEKEERIAVYDFGGGTFDITIIELLDDIFEVLSTAGDNFLGGDDFDLKLVGEMTRQFEKQHGFSVKGDSVAMQRIRSVAERVKCQLSTIDEVNATLRELTTSPKGEKVHFSFSINRDRFETLVGPLVERTMATCEEALELAKLKPTDLDNVVLVGGSTRIPLVRKEVATFFGKKPRTEVNPDEVVAIGAAINAFSLTQEALDKDIKAIRRQRPVNEPFARVATPTKTVATGKAPAMGDSSGLARTVRSSRIPAAPRPSSPPPPRKVDPFSRPQTPFGSGVDDPFADSATRKDAKPLVKIPLSTKRTIVGLSAVNRDEMGVTDLPAAVPQKGEADLPALKIGPTEDSGVLDLPGPLSPASDADLPALKEPKQVSSKERTMTDLPTIARPPADKADLPAVKDGEIDLPGTTDGEVDLPVARPGEVDLPVARPGEVDLPVARPGEVDLPAQMGSKDTTALGLPTLKRPLPPPFESDGPAGAPLDEPIAMAPIELDESGEALEITESEIEFETNTAPPVADDALIGEAPQSFGDVDLDLPPVDSISADEEDLFSKPLAPRRPAPTADPAIAIDADNDFNTTPFDRDGEVEDPFSLPGAAVEAVAPLDEVAGNNGLEAEPERHEEWVVPVKSASPAVLLDVTPRGLGVATVGGYCDIIIERNAAIPLEQSRHFSTSRDNQTEVFIDVYQGEERRTDENTLLGRIELTGLRAAPRGEISILVTFEIDTDGILNVKAVNEETNESHSTSIKLSGGLEDQQVDALVEKYSGNGKGSGV